MDPLPIAFLLAMRANKMGGAMPVGLAAAAYNGDDESDNEQVFGGVMDLGNQERPEVEQLRHGAEQAIAGICY